MLIFLLDYFTLNYYMQHQLNFKIDDDIQSTSFTIRDLSFFYSNIPVNDLTLEIYSPSSASPVYLTNLTPSFVEVVTVNNLHLNATGQYPLPDLPDGAYYIRLSVAPNRTVYTDGTYFRNTRLQTKYLSTISEVMLNRHLMNSKQYDKKVSDLLWFKELIDCSKYMGEDTLNLKAANEIYAEVDELLTNFNKCITC